MLTDLDIKDIDGWTPLMFAARSKSPAIVHYLLQRGVDPNRQQVIRMRIRNDPFTLFVSSFLSLSVLQHSI